ncbi:hypothetical protein PZA11_006849 [Diplocarpon coronariae]|uniref:Acyltransferase 3 domain-containing protein n=1 Tax=Diplocarpon coronariae TaxID=2795749 RepID=A0A218Z7Q0_9HELO|nr:hypothetical protein JHW43_006627 [Diplocarpon mali]OWP03734.1 hypothetical protein B2J93_6077 [Marssonina coronariae]
MAQDKFQELRPVGDGNSSPISDHTLFVGSGKRVVSRAALGLLPSFLQRRLRSGLSNKAQRLRPTSYLDGLRGVASFVVFMGHYTEETVGWYSEPYGAYEDGAPSSPLQLPFVRVLYASRPMVHIFFIISGYVLSYKPLRQIHAQDYAALTRTLSSSVFRRALRLFLPSFATLFVMALALFYGLSDQRYAEREMFLSGQLSHLWRTCLQMIEASWGIKELATPHPQYNPALWTIPIEFAQSLLLFVALLGLSRCLVSVRLFLLAGMTIFCFSNGRLYTVEFLGGMFIAEWNLLQNRPPDTPVSSPVATLLPKYEEQPRTAGDAIMQRLATAFWLATFASGLFIASWTNIHVDGAWGIRFLDAHTPRPYSGQEVWFCLAAFQIVAACTQLTCLQSLFNTEVAQYLGNISYALYLTHNLCLRTLEPRFGPLFGQLLSMATFWGRQLTWLAGLAIYLPFLICVADFFWRVVDTPSVKLARWLEEKCTVEKET